MTITKSDKGAPSPNDKNKKTPRPRGKIKKEQREPMAIAILSTTRKITELTRAARVQKKEKESKASTIYEKTRERSRGGTLAEGGSPALDANASTRLLGTTTTAVNDKRAFPHRGSGYVLIKKN
jgi:hypothetical protein